MRSLNLKLALTGSERLSNPLQRVRRSGTATAEALRNTREQLRNLQRTERTANAFTNTQQSLQRTNQELTQARQRVRDLSAAQRHGEGGTKRFAAEMRKASLQVRDLSQRSREQRQRLNEQRQALQQAGMNTAQLSNSKRELSSSIARANQRLTEQQDRLRRTGDAQRRNTELARRHGQQMMRLGIVGATGYGAMSVGRRSAQSAVRLLAPGADFDSTMSHLQALTRLQSNDPALAELRAQARQLGATTLHTSGDVASGQAFLAMAGFTPKAIRAAMPGVLDMATAGGMDLARTADIASNILGGFRLEAGKMGRVSDVLTKTFTTSNTSMEMLGESMKYVGPIAAAANVRLEQAAAMAGLLGDVGIQGSEAGTTLRAMLLRLSAPTGGAAKALRGLGMSITDELGNIRDMTDILEELSWAMESLGEGEQLRLLKEIFGERPAAGVTELLRQAGQGNLRRYTTEVADSDGEAGRTAATMADNLRGDLDELRSAWADVRIQLFDENEGMLRNLVSSITGRVRNLGEWVKANPRTVQFISKLALGLIAVTTVLGGLTVGLITVLGPMLILRFLLARLGFSLLPLLGKAAAVNSKGLGLLLAPLRLLPRSFALLGSALVRLPNAWAAASPARFAAGLGAMARGVGSSLTQFGAQSMILGTRVWALTTGPFRAAARGALTLQRGLQTVALTTAMTVRTQGLLGASLSALKAGTLGVGGALKTALIAPLKLVGHTVLFIGRALLMNPIGLAITAIAVAGWVIVKYWQPIKAFFSGFWQGLMEGLAPLRESLTGLGSMLEPLKPIWNWFTEKLGVAWEWVSKLIKPFAATGEQIEGATEKGRSFGLWLGELIAILGNITGAVWGFGANIVTGLWDGIADKINWLKDKVTSFSSLIRSWFTNDLEIHSPSRVFASYGRNTLEGYQVGLDHASRETLNKVSGVSKRIKAAGAGLVLGSAAALPAMADYTIDTRRPLSASAPTVHVAGDTITLQIYAGPEMNARAIAIEVQKILDQRERQKAARARSLLHD